MKIRPEQFVAGLLAAKSGELAGQEAARRENERLDDVAGRNVMAAFQTVMGLARDQENQRLARLNNLGRVVNSADFDPDSPDGQRLQAEFLRGLQEPGAQPDFGALAGLLRRDPRSARAAERLGLRLDQFAQPPVMPRAPGDSTGAVPSPGVGSPFGGRKIRLGFEEIGRQLKELQTRAVDAGDSDAERRLAELGLKLQQRPQGFQPEHAFEELNGVRTGLQAKRASKDLDEDLKRATGLLARMETLRPVHPEMQQEYDQVSAALQTADTSTPEGLAQAKAALDRYNVLIQKGPFGRPYSAEKADEDRAVTAEFRAHNTNNRLLDDIRAARNEGQLMEAVRAQRAFAAQQPSEYGIRPFGGEELDEKPRTVVRRVPTKPGFLAGEAQGPATEGPHAEPTFRDEPGEETVAEVKARMAQGLHGLLDDPKQRASAARMAFPALLATVRSPVFERMDDDQRRRTLAALNEVGQTLEIPAFPEEVANRLTEKERLDFGLRDRAQDLREWQAQVSQYRADLTAARQEFDARFRTWKESRSLTGAQREQARSLEQRIGKLSGQIDWLQRAKKPDWPLIQALGKDLGGLVDELKTLGGGVKITPAPQLQQPPRPAAPGAAPVGATGGLTQPHTVVLNGKGATVTLKGVAAALRRQQPSLSETEALRQAKIWIRDNRAR